jgi:hypothetical protein
VHVRSEFADVVKATLVTLRLQDRPVGDDATAKLVVPENPLRAVAEITRLALEPADTVSPAELAEIAKSVILRSILAEWNTPPLVPVTVTV